ncbi:MAG TPA: LysR family transcriptional regulator [Ideonella sp.]|uniref:LysR family transcriptional regulator n=1 Tax=Ideonella sp. TaxID=1929293 RepID=UPI002BB4BB6E|nr:LysR family transcriptional regulator [Ideonella sp.]HSI52163.1 LysR family transcriptional regulator [Ideonella sp.]
MNILRLTLRQLQIFVAVAQAGSTSAAGEVIALSQSATSAAVNELERLLGLKLFDRAGKRLLLNDNGRALLPRALGLLDGAAGVEQMARNPDAQLQALRIGASTTLGSQLLPGLLKRFYGEVPQQAAHWQAEVMVGNTAQVCAAVAVFELDIGLIEGPCHEPALQVQPWLTDELVLVAAPGTEARLALKALRDCVWLLREPGSGTREAMDQALLPHLRGYRRSIALGSSEAIRQAAIEGLGVACLSRWLVADALAAGRLVQLRTPLPPLRRQCHWVTHRDKQPTQALQRFITLLAAAADTPLPA